MNCSLCGRKIREDRPYISGAESIDINVHVSCMYTAKPIDILHMLQLDIVFCYLNGRGSTPLAEMYPDIDIVSAYPKELLDKLRKELRKEIDIVVETITFSNPDSEMS